MQTPSGAGTGVVTGAGGMVEGGTGTAARAAATAGERTTNLHRSSLNYIMVAGVQGVNLIASLECQKPRLRNVGMAARYRR